ncbi:MAG: formate dehydrogenase accessory protein FdhE [Bacteroidota bacterium]
MKQINSIKDNLEILAPFISGLNKYLEKSRALSLFKKLPIRDDKENINERLSEGSYLFSPCGIEIRESESNSLALELVELLKIHLVDRIDEIKTINDYLVSEKINPHDIILSTIKNEGNKIRKQIQQLNLSEDLFTFFLIFLARPFREQAAAFLLEEINKLIWLYGYCPVCGHWPALAHINEETGERTLWCVCCNTKWKFKRTQCVFCLNENHEFLEILSPVNEGSYRIHTCKKCKRYLKEVKSNDAAVNFPFDKMYLGTIPLDMIAEKQGFIQESILTVRYDNSTGNELLMYRQKAIKEKISIN